jgi:hypothetical protein
MILLLIIKYLHSWCILVLLTETRWVGLSLLLTELHEYFTGGTWIFLYLWLGWELMMNLCRYLLVLHYLRNWFTSALIFWELSYFIHLSLCSKHFIWYNLHFLRLITINTFYVFLVSCLAIAIIFEIALLFLSAH